MPRDEGQLTTVLCAECGTHVMSPSLTAGELLTRHADYCAARAGGDPSGSSSQSSSSGRHRDR